MAAAGRAVSYECEDLDAGLPMHAHAPGSGMEHDIRCDAGRILVWVHPDEAHVLEAGQRLAIDTTRWHGIVPLTLGAAFTNTTQGFEHEAATTVLDSPHHAPPWVIDRLSPGANP
jgi:hypothetical protein